MVELVMRRRGSGFFPVDQEGEAFVSRLPDGADVLVDAKRPRSLPHTRKLFALLNLILANQERYASKDELLDAVKVHIGHCETMFMRDGTEVKRPKSISFHAMDQDAFNEFYERVLDCVCKDIIPNLDKEATRRELQEFAQ